MDIILKTYGDSKDGTFKGATAFEQSAEIVAEALGTASRQGKSGTFISISADEIPELQEKLGSEYEIKIEHPRFKAYINENKHNASIFGRGAQVLADHLGITPPMTEGENPKPYLRFPKEKIAEYQEILSEVADIEISVNKTQHKPKIRINEIGEGEQARIFDQSAKNAADILGVEPGKTSGGRPMIEFSDRESYIAARKQLKQAAEVTVQDYEPKVTIAIYETLDYSGAVIMGKHAPDIAAIAGLDELDGQNDFSTGNVRHKLKLSLDEVDRVQSVLETHGYIVEQKQMDVKLKANVLTTKDGGYLFGKPAESVAEHLGMETSQTMSGNAKLTLDNGQLEVAKEVLSSQGYELSERPAQRRSIQRKSQSQKTGEAKIDIGFMKSTKAIAEAIIGIPLSDISSVQDQTFEVGEARLTKQGQSMILKRGDTEINFEVDSNGFVSVDLESSKGIRGEKISPENSQVLSAKFERWKAQLQAQASKPKPQPRHQHPEAQTSTAESQTQSKTALITENDGKYFTFSEAAQCLGKEMGIEVGATKVGNRARASIPSERIDEAKQILSKNGFFINQQSTAKLQSSIATQLKAKRRSEKVAVSAGRD